MRILRILDYPEESVQQIKAMQISKHKLHPLLPATDQQPIKEEVLGIFVQTA
jgi:hypothetical protein